MIVYIIRSNYKDITRVFSTYDKAHAQFEQYKLQFYKKFVRDSLKDDFTLIGYKAE